VSQETIGRYLCKASVPGFADIAEQSTVYLKGPPTITSSRRQFGTPGEAARVECIAFSIPKARHVVWTFNGREINNTLEDEFSMHEELLPFGIKSTLAVRPSAPKHFGRYNCTVINDYGYDILEIELNGESKCKLSCRRG
jgi:Immunoglobulin domain